MYTITFYSFKGGVGRTMALVNVAAELVRRGRTVLVVDFDLEAPGLETYKHLQPPKPHQGIVEYVTEFRKSYQVPDLRDYVYETKPIGKKGGHLWVMPAGRRDRAYRAALGNLDWQQLYKHQDGFLLFEDTKKGWEIELKPDYVLIDSRTGDTDVLGICTRQLPDSVVLMFTPNEQNLVGLENVCRDIRREETEGLKKRIILHFVASNVPDLDDEHRILRRHLRAFRDRLDFKELSGVVRRYENLNLLDQSVFTIDRPHSKLARSYRQIHWTLLMDNLADRDGAMAFLQSYPQRLKKRVDSDRTAPSMHSEHFPISGEKFAEQIREAGITYLTGHDGQVFVPASKDPNSSLVGYAAQENDKTCLNEIAKQFRDDVEVLCSVADSYVLEEDYNNALHTFDRVLELEPYFGLALFQRATCKINLAQTDQAAEDLLVCLRSQEHLAKFGTGCLGSLSEIGAARLRKVADALRAYGSKTMSLPIAAATIAKLSTDDEEQEPRYIKLFYNFRFVRMDARSRQGDYFTERCLGRLQDIAPSKLSDAADILEAQGFRNVSPEFVADCLLNSEDGVPRAAQLLRKHLPSMNEAKRQSASFIWTLLGAHCWREVIELLESQTAEEMSFFSLLALAFAHWGEHGELPESVCRQALAQFEQEAKDEGLTHDLFHSICIVWLLWRLGDVATALHCLESAEKKARAESDKLYSLWRLREVTAEQFLDDCKLVRRMLQGEILRPAFLGPVSGKASSNERTRCVDVDRIAVNDGA